MSKVMITESYLEDIADAIRVKNGSSDTYKPSEMSGAIEDIPGGITPTGTISITSNGTVDVTQYASAAVSVPGITPTGTINITQNGTVDVTNYASASVAVPNPSTGTKQISITQNGTTTEDVTNYASAEISASVTAHPGFVLFGEKEVVLSEYTDTANWENTDTQISMTGCPYAYLLIIVTCNSAITTSTEWGMTVAIGGRYGNGKIMIGTNSQQKGCATFDFSAMTAATNNQLSYGAIIQTNQGNVVLGRKAHSTNCTKLRAGTYKISVYGMSSL